MNWESVYLFCFVAGVMLTVVSVFGAAHLHLHVPHINVHHGGHGVSPLNISTLMMFLTWFGGAGYILTHYRSSAATLALLIALMLGFAGAAITYLFLVRVLIGSERPLLASDYVMQGVLGRLSVPIRAGDGTGELIYSQQGTRRSCGARSEDGAAIDRGTEVVVMRYENGIAYVRPWQQMASDLL